MKSFTSFILATFVASVAFAHEGHGHSDTAEAPHGGILKEGKALNIEVVSKGAEVLLYPLSKEGKPLAGSDVSLAVTSQAPKKAKAKVDVKAMEDHFSGTVKDSGSYRYELVINVTYKGIKESLKLQVEPKD